MTQSPISRMRPVRSTTPRISSGFTQPRVGCRQPQQRFDPHEVSPANVDDGLVGQLELGTLEGIAQIAHQLTAPVGRGSGSGIEGAVLTSAVALGLVHGEVSITQQRVGELWPGPVNAMPTLAETARVSALNSKAGLKAAVIRCATRSAKSGSSMPSQR